jgi:hypothetical protein
MGTGGPYPEAKAGPGRDVDHSSPFSAENEYELYLLSPKHLRGVQWDSFSFLTWQLYSQGSVNDTAWFVSVRRKTLVKW